MIQIKNIYIGLCLVLSSAIIYAATLIAASIYSQTFAGTDGQDWNGQHGVFGTAIREMGTIPIIIAVLLGIAGIICIVKSKKD